MALCVSRIQCKHSGSFGTPKKPDMATVEQVSLKATVCWHLGQELMGQVPVTEAKVTQFWYDPFAQGDSEVENQIDMVLMDKSSNFNVQRDAPILRRLCEELNFNKPVGVTAEAELSLTLDKWQLVKKQLEYDQAVYETWRRKCSSIQQAAEQAKHEWRLNRRRTCVQAAKTFMSTYIHLVAWTQRRPEVDIAEVMNFKKTIVSRSGCHPDKLSYLAYWNASVTSLIPKEIYNQQVGMISWLLSDNMESMACCLLPVHTYNKGRLSLEEKTLLEKLQQSGNHNCDWSFHIVFSQKVDARDMRPMVYSGKLVFPSPLELNK